MRSTGLLLSLALGSGLVACSGEADTKTNTGAADTGCNLFSGEGCEDSGTTDTGSTDTGGATNPRVESQSADTVSAATSASTGQRSNGAGSTTPSARSERTPRISAMPVTVASSDSQLASTAPRCRPIAPTIEVCTAAPTPMSSAASSGTRFVVTRAALSAVLSPAGP